MKIYFRQIFEKKKAQISNYTKISPVGVAVFHADGRMDTQDKANNNRFSQFCEITYKNRKSPVLLQYKHIVRNTALGHKGTSFTLYTFFSSEFQLKYILFFLFDN